MPVPKVVTIGWKRSSAMQTPLKTPAHRPTASPAAIPASTAPALCPPISAITLTATTFAKAMMLPTDRSISPPRMT